MSLGAWYERCKAQKPSRNYAGSEIAFREYAGLVAQGRILKDWRAFREGSKDMSQKMRDAETRDFLEEVREVSEKTKNKPFLEPIQKDILDTLNRIESHYNIVVPSIAKESPTQEHERIIWNAPKTLLYALFLDLGQRLSDGQPCLSGTCSRIARLIADNFADANKLPFDLEDAERYLCGDSRKRIARKIKLDVNDTVKVPAPDK